MTQEERAQEIRKAALSGFAWNVPAWEDVHHVARAHWMARAQEQILSERTPTELGPSTEQNDPAKYALRRIDEG